MEDAMKLLLEDIQQDIRETKTDMKTIQKNIIYLCRHTACSENRLKNIEDNLKLNNGEINKFNKRISTIEGKLVSASVLIAVVISSIVSLIV